MPRKKKTETKNPESTITAASAVVVEDQPRKEPGIQPADKPEIETPAANRPAPETDAGEPEPRRYRPFFTCNTKGFEASEDFRFKQVVFRFKENPGPEVTAKLKDAGYVYRPTEKAWTVPASATARELAVRIARELKGEELGQGR